jgi:LPS-assembly lipoprotein
VKRESESQVVNRESLIWERGGPPGGHQHERPARFTVRVSRFALHVSRFTIAAALCVIVAGCGFKLRGEATLPFKTIAVTPQSALGVSVSRNIVAGTNAKVVDRPQEAEAILLITGETRDKVILSLNSDGRVREYTLRYRVTYRVIDGKGSDFVPASEILLRRDITFNDQVLAKESEEALLYNDMQRDAVSQIIRRLSAARLRPAEEEIPPYKAPDFIFD